LNIIRTESRNLATLAAKFLDTSKIESGNFEIRPQPVNIGELLAEQKAVFEINGKVSISVAIENDPPLMANVDPDMLKMALMNIIENAIKYTDGNGNVRVSAKNKNDELLVSVEDHGPGIPAEERETIFDKFYRGGNTGKSKGSSLGLAIAKSIVEAHAGRIWCDSELGVGTTISFSLPKSAGNQMFYI
jgi:signal transduction histidine kinase